MLIKDRSEQTVRGGGHGRGTSLPCLGAHGAARKAAWGMWAPSSRSQKNQRSPGHELTSWKSHRQSLPMSHSKGQPLSDHRMRQRTRTQV